MRRTFVLCLPLLAGSVLAPAAAATDDPVAAWNRLRQEAGLLAKAEQLGPAEDRLHQALAIARTALDARTQVVTLVDLGLVCRRQGQAVRSEQHLREALLLQDRQPGPRYPATAVILDYLGLALREQHRLADALAAHQQALAWGNAQSPPDPVQIAATHFALAAAHEAAGQQDAAVQQYQEALRRTAGHGLDALDTGRALTGLARLAAHHGQVPQAERYLHQAKAHLTTVLAPDSRGWLEYLDAEGTVFFGRTRYTEAGLAWERAQALAEQHLGPGHPGTLTLMMRRAELLTALDDRQPALALLTRCRTLRERVLGPDHPDTAVVLAHLGLLHYRQREYVAAADLLQRARTVLEAHAADHRVELALVLSVQGHVLAAQGGWREAAPLLHRCWQLNLTEFGTHHPAVNKALWAYAQALRKCDRKQEARAYEEQARALTGDADRQQYTVDVRTLRAGH